ncbi:MAG TPA: YciI family protein [Actinomycetota bacterium]|nr:YciI family protein [Actinomycetota bacterium]
MTRYLISFDDGDMTFPEEDLPAVADASHAVVREAKAAGVWIWGGGLLDFREMSVVGTDGTVTDGPRPDKERYIGGFSILDVPSRGDALAWAAKIAAACRCAQEVREIMYDPES